MDEYISREATVKAYCEKCQGYYDGHCIHRGECDVDVIVTAPVAVDTQAIIKHLDSLMICITNAYNTSHFLLQSDMAHIEKQAERIKELLTNKED